MDVQIVARRQVTRRRWKQLQGNLTTLRVPTIRNIPIQGHLTLAANHVSFTVYERIEQFDENGRCHQRARTSMAEKMPGIIEFFQVTRTTT